MKRICALLVLLAAMILPAASQTVWFTPVAGDDGTEGYQIDYAYAEGTSEGGGTTGPGCGMVEVVSMSFTAFNGTSLGTITSNGYLGTAVRSEYTSTPGVVYPGYMDAIIDVTCVKSVGYRWYVDFEFAQSSLLNTGHDLACTEIYCTWIVTPVCSNIPAYDWADIDLLPPGVNSSITNPPSSWQAYAPCERILGNKRWTCAPSFNKPGARSPTYCSYNP
jgi:hypothetical protein